MNSLIIREYGTHISFSQNRIVVCKDGERINELPIETVESVDIYSRAQMTTQCMLECVGRGISVIFYSSYGSFLCKLDGNAHNNVARQRKQAVLYDTEFALEISRLIVASKIRNQGVLLRRHARDKRVNVDTELERMKYASFKSVRCNSIETLIGYEGIAARNYFKGLRKVVDPAFDFKGRSQFPPEDCFNSMLSLGYSIITKEIMAKVYDRGLNPYFGFMHRDRYDHPSLVSDLVEEWRSVIADSLVLSLVNKHIIKKEDFDESLKLSRSALTAIIKLFQMELS